MRGRRRSFQAAVLGTLAVLVLGACGVAVAPPASPTFVGSLAGRTGVNPGSAILWMNDADRNRELDQIAATGAGWISVDFDWNSIQAWSASDWRWDVATDKLVRGAKARGLKVLAMLAYSPTWARRPACANTSHCLPANPDDFARFAGAAAARYGSNSNIADLRGTVVAYQLWNEPNHYPFVQPTVDVAGYTAMLVRAYPAIKAADPTATVLTGATSPAGDDPSGRDMAPATFLEGIYAHGGGGSFDAAAHHPYSFPYSPLVEAHWNSFQQTKTMYDVMVRNGDGGKKIWGTESGAPTGTDPGRSVSEETQSQFVADYFRGWHHDYAEFSGPLFWFQLRDNDTNLAFYEDNFGLLRRDWTKKLAYDEFTRQIANT
ncbi:MAG: hypothetical protein FJW88_10075 [Actinobacteria bacterium]|nr:hypothetical protein [Actinomycetota bacterium]